MGVLQMGFMVVNLSEWDLPDKQPIRALERLESTHISYYQSIVHTSNIFYRNSNIRAACRESKRETNKVFINAF